MNRRSFLLGVAALPAIGMFPSTAIAQGIGPLEAAQGASALYGAISTRKFQNETLSQLRAISHQLGVVNAKLDQVLDLLRAFPQVLMAALDQNYRRQLSDNLTAREQTIFSRVEAVQELPEVPLEALVALGALVDQQATVRAQLSSFSLASYPIAARAFASEAIGLKAMRNQTVLFEVRKTEVANRLEIAASEFATLAFARDEVARVQKGYWDRLARPAYIGSQGRSAFYAFYSIIKGSFETGVLEHRLFQTPITRHPGDYLEAGHSEFVSLPTVSAMGEREQRHAAHVNGLQQASQLGRQALAQAMSFREHQNAAKLMADSIRSMTYS